MVLRVWWWSVARVFDEFLALALVNLKAGCDNIHEISFNDFKSRNNFSSDKRAGTRPGHGKNQHELMNDSRLISGRINHLGLAG